MKINLIKKIVSNRVIQHTLFWSLSFFIFARTFRVSAEVKEIDLIYSALFHISIIIGVYINLFLLIPFLLKRNRFLFYSMGLIIDILFASFINDQTFDKIVSVILPDYFFISYYEYVDIFKFMIVYIGLTTLLKLSKSWFKVKEIESEKNLTELKALKAQVNPHFLFNSLNSIYSLVITQSKKAPEIIVKLSDILRYVLYDTQKDLISLKDEIQNINNYLELQKIRADNRAKVIYLLEGEIQDQKIAPLLYLPLIENSFKHGIKGEIDNPYIDIQLTVLKKKIIFLIKNNKGVIDVLEKDKNSGIGIENLRKRLEIFCFSVKA